MLSPNSKSLLALVALVALTLMAGCSKTGIQSQVERGEVEGTVRDAYTDEPLPGAVVTIGDRSAVIGEDGVYRFDRLPEGPASIMVSMPGYETYYGTVVVDTETEFHVFLDQIGRFASLSGRVYLGQSRLSMSGVLVTAAFRSVITDSAGSFSFDSLRPDTYTVRARLNNYIMFEMPVAVSGHVEYDIHMAATSLDGQVWHKIDGPVPGVTVDVAGLTGTTDADGRYYIPQVPQGRHPITATHPEYITETRSVFLNAAPASMDLQIRREVLDTVVVIDDATISWNNFEGCPDCPVWSSAAENSGMDERLTLGHYLVPDPAAPSGAWTAVSRAILRLPPIPDFIEPDEFAGAMFSFTPASVPEGGSIITVRRIAADVHWTETDIIWNSQPETWTIPYAVYSVGNLSPLFCDVTALYAGHLNPEPELLIQADESGQTQSSVLTHIHSRQSQVEVSRPVVMFRYVR